MSPNDADGMANSVDRDQTAPLGEEQSDLGLYCLPWLICPKTEDHYGILFQTNAAICPTSWPLK